MSGGLAALAAYFWPNVYARIGFVVFCIFAWLFATYRIWEMQYKRANTLEAKQNSKSKLELSFDPNDIDGCVLLAPSENPAIKNFRVKVEVIGETTLTGCKGSLVSISGTRSFNGEPMTLSFTPASESDTLSKTIDPGGKEYLDVLTISWENIVRPHTYGFKYPGHFNYYEFFKNHGVYVFDISVRSNESGTQNIKLKMNWVGDWMTTNLEVIN